MSNAKSAFLNILLQKNWQTLPGLPAGCRGKRVGLVVLYESGGRYNIDPNSKLSNPFITIKLLFYDDIFHHAALEFSLSQIVWQKQFLQKSATFEEKLSRHLVSRQLAAAEYKRRRERDFLWKIRLFLEVFLRLLPWISRNCAFLWKL